MARHEERKGEGLPPVVHDRGFLLFLAGAVAAPFVYMQTPRRSRSPWRTPTCSLALYGALAALNGT